MTNEEGAETETTIFYSDDYTAAACGADTMRKSAWIARSLRRKPIDGVRLVAPEPLTAAQLGRVHAPEYVEAVRTGSPRALAESNGLEWDKHVWTSACASSGGAVAAVLEALRTGRNAGSLSSGLHHARAASGSGFCTFNGLALGACAALDAGAERVLIVDLDAHCGGGTASLTDHQRVAHVDVSVSGFDSYSAIDSRHTLDIVRSADDYLGTIERRLDQLPSEVFDLVLYNAGMDPHQASLGGSQGITFELLAARERLVFEWARQRRVPVAFVLAGGYLGSGLSEEKLAGLHRLTIATAALANRGRALQLHHIMEAAYASPHRGTEGFSFDANGRKSDAGFHDDLLGDEDDDPFAYDLTEYLKLSAQNQRRFERERYDHPGRQSAFLKELLEG